MTRVLVVEDSPTQASQIQIILGSSGFAVDVARDGEEGLAKFQDGHFDLIITDVVMPGLSGYDLCRRIKSDPRGKETPVILLTSLGDPVDIIHGLEAGADNFLTKPYDPEYLVYRVRSVLENRRMRAVPKVSVGVEFMMLGRKFTITSEKEQILDLLVSSFEDIVRTNRELSRSQEELAQAKALVEQYASRLEERAERSEQRYQSLVESASDAIVGADGDGRIVLWNASASRIFGYSLEEALGMPVSHLVPEHLRDDHETDLRACIRGSCPHGPGKTVQKIGLRKDGSEFPMEMSIAFGRVGSEILLTGLYRDVTDRTTLETQFRQAQKMEAVGRLAGGVAHDFNNLLTVILGSAEELMAMLGEDHPAAAPVADIRRAGERAASLTRQLLAFSHCQPLNPQLLDINQTVKEVEKMLRRLIGEDIQLQSVLTASPVKIKADPTQLEQVLLNLAVNARDAMPDGGYLTIETADAELDEYYAELHNSIVPGRYVMLAVSDTGCGMDKETQARIFDPFFTTKGPERGTGLGLATVYGIVKQSGGHISVYSEPGDGTCFRLYFPVAQEVPVEPVKPAPSRPVTRFGVETVLIVEDDEDIRRLCQRTLARGGYTVLSCANGVEALEICARHPGPIHLVVSDVVMPRMGGAELAARLATERPDTKILFLSGYTETSMTHGRLFGPDTTILSKPFTPDALIQKVREAMDGPACPP
jgi:two-component system cell cycle sensor histidine kinase/response regulator CckA